MRFVCLVPALLTETTAALPMTTKIPQFFARFEFSEVSLLCVG